MAIIKKFTNNKCWRRYREKATLVHRLLECKLVQLLWKTVFQRFLKKPKTELPYNPAIPLLDLYLGKMKTLHLQYKDETLYSKRYTQMSGHRATVYTS